MTVNLPNLLIGRDFVIKGCLTMNPLKIIEMAT